SAKGDDKFITTDYLQQCRGENLLLLTIIETKRSCFEMATKMRIIAYIDFTNVVFKHYFLLLPVPNQLHGCML
ncbi:hypothetical protein R1X06_17305, partial [Acinetobacter baumannii]|uniref:hypothetical protein n=1 Tax=Acinetobacter baumannii TaxID=470 RepID=UPI00298D7833